MDRDEIIRNSLQKEINKIRDKYLPGDIIYPVDYHVVIWINDLKWLLCMLEKLNK